MSLRGGINLSGFTNLEKGEKVSIDKKEFIDEHKKLVNILNSPSHKDDKKEAKEQEAELEEIEKGKKAAIGTISNGYKKVAEGQWKKVSKQGKTQLEHADEEKLHRHLAANAPKSEKKEHEKTADEHYSHKIALDSNDYDDAHVESQSPVAKTKTGKDIYPTADNSNHSDFTVDEHKEAAAHHRVMMFDDYKNVAHHKAQMNAHNAKADEKHEAAVKEHIAAQKMQERNKGKIADLMKERKQLLSDMEQEAEPEGGPIADRYGRELEKIDNKIEKLRTIKKSEDMFIPDSVSKETLVKSHIGYQFSNSENLAISKKGSEVKEKLMNIKDKLTTEASGHQAKMEALRATIPTAPTDKMDGYVSDGMDVASQPAVYNWGETYYDSCSSKVSEAPIAVNGEEAAPQKSQEQIICESKREYNRCAEKFVSIQSEIKLVDTMINNMVDTQVYKLTVKQAAVLGF